MSDLSQKMQERLDKWRENTTTPPSVKKIFEPTSRRSGKNDFGDAMTLDEWNEEAKRSQTRR